MKRTQRIVIGRNDDLLRNCIQEAKQRNLIITKINIFFERYQLQPIEPTQYEGVNFINAFGNSYQKANKEAYPKHLTSKEILTAAEIDIQELHTLQSQWNKLHLPFDFNTLSAPSNLDVNIYAANEEEERRYKAARALADAHNIFFSEVGRPHVNNATLKLSSGGALVVDPSTLQITTNTNWVQKLMIIY